MSARAASVMAPPAPQVNLLPPEVKAARGLARTKRWLALAVVLALLVSGGVVVLAMMAQSAAEEELALADAETERLMRLQEQYADVPQMRGALDRARTARLLGMGPEVLWRPYMEAIAAALPDDVRIQTIEVRGVTPMTASSAPTDALQAWSMYTISFTVDSRTVPDTGQWIIDLAAVPGFADPWFSQALVGEADGVVSYTVQATVQVNELAFALRFATSADEAGSDTEAEEG